MKGTNDGGTASDNAGGISAAAARWSDPKVCAQALLDNSTRWKGLFVSNEIPPASSMGEELLDQLEREYVRGGDPHYPGRFSTAPGPGDATRSLPTTGTAATPAAIAPKPARGDAARPSRTASTPSTGVNPLLAQNSPQRLPPPDKPERLPPVLPVNPTSPANPRLSREEQLEADWQRELQRAQIQVSPPASNATALKSFLEGQARKYTSTEILKWIGRHPEIIPLLQGGRPPANTPRGRKPRFNIVPRIGLQKGHPTVGFDITVVW